MRSQLTEAAAKVAVTEDLTLNMNAAEVSPKELRSLQHHLRSQVTEVPVETAVIQDLALSQQTREAIDMLLAELLASSATSTRDS